MVSGGDTATTPGSLPGPAVSAPLAPCEPCVPVSGGGRAGTPPNRKTAPLGPVSPQFGAFDFCTRIKGGGRKRPPPGHKAPQCGAFQDSEEGAPFRPRRRFQVVGNLRNLVFPAGSGLFDRRCWDVWARRLDPCQSTQILRRKSKNKALRKPQMRGC